MLSRKSREAWQISSSESQQKQQRPAFKTLVVSFWLNSGGGICAAPRLWHPAQRQRQVQSLRRGWEAPLGPVGPLRASQERAIPASRATPFLDAFPTVKHHNKAALYCRKGVAREAGLRRLCLPLIFGFGSDDKAVLSQRKKERLPPKQSCWTHSQNQVKSLPVSSKLMMPT